MKVVDLKALAKEHSLRGYSRLKKADLIIFIKNNLPPVRTRPPPTWEPIPATCNGPPPQLVRLKLERPRQPELLRQLEERPVRPRQPELLMSQSGPLPLNHISKNLKEVRKLS